MAVRINSPHLAIKTDFSTFDRASPRLKDAEIPADRIRDLYVELLVILRTMFARCKLVHADFSEYNILFVPLPRRCSLELTRRNADSTKVISG